MTCTSVISDHVVRIAGWRRMFRTVLLSASALLAQSGDWAQVQALAPGSTVEVKRLSRGGELRGTVESVSADKLVLRRDADSVAVDRADVRRLRLRTFERTKTGRIIGATVGLVLGIPASRVIDGSSVGGSVLVAGAYSGIGYLVGRGFDRQKRIAVYKAERP